MISVRDGLQKKREREFRVHILKIQQKEGIKRKKKKTETEIRLHFNAS